MTLTAKRIERLLARGEPTKIRDTEVRGLLLSIKSKTSASWLLRYQLNHKETFLGLGSARDVPLKVARERAREARLKLSDGVDPLAAKREAKATLAVAAAKTMTFQQAAEAFYNANFDRWTNAKFRAQFLSAMKTYVYPTIGQLPVRAIDTALAIQVLTPIWKSKTTTANRLRGWIEMVLAFAQVRGLREGDNPARWRGHLETIFAPMSKLAPVKHFVSLPYDELPGFLAQLRKREGSAAKALEFLILTAARSGEVLGATWNEIDLDNALWTIPASRMKSSREHRVPLTKAALDLLKSLPTHRGDGENSHVFIGGRPGTGLSHIALYRVMKRLNRRETTHGFRSTFRVWCSERTNFPDIIAEQALAHAVGSAVERVYRRSDMLEKRRKLMEQWSTFCTVPAASGAKVVPMKRR